jgi:cell wall-associated NlpC family hydrolase
MSFLSGLSRIGRAILILAVASACAARTSPTTMPHPAPFPAPSSPQSITLEREGETPAAGALIRTARSLEGVPYQWGGDSPNTGFDCSGFVQYVLARHQIALPRTSAEQFLVGTEVDLDHVRAGDLVFFSTVAPGASHVGLAISHEEFIHAPAASGVVRVDRVRAPYWSARYVGARRVF